MRTAALLLIAGSLLPAQESIDPKELRVSSSAYWPPSQRALHSEARLVEVVAVVRDDRGRPVPGLTRADFELRDEGKKRELTAFSVQRAPAQTAGAPGSAGSAPETLPVTPPASRSIALLFDDVNSTAQDFQQVRNAALRFVKEGLAPGDRAGIFTTTGSQVLPFTSDVARLTAAIAGLNPRTREGRSVDCPSLSPYLAYVIANNLDRHALTAKVLEMQQCDPGSQPPPPAPGARPRASKASSQPVDVSVEDPIALKVIRHARMIWNEQEVTSKDTLDVIENVVDLLAAQPGQRMLLLGSDGFLAGSLQSRQQTVITHAVRAGVVINSLDAKGLYTIDLPTNAVGGVFGRASIYAAGLGSRPKDATNEVMANLSEGTGGRFFQNNNDLAAGFSQLTEVPEVSYLLGFAPADPDGKFHALKVQVPRGKGYSVQARLGYFSEKDSPGAPREERKIDREVFTTGQSHDAPVGLEVTSQPSGNAGTTLRAVFHVDVRTLPFVERSGARTETLSFLLVLLDTDGNFVCGREGAMEFALKQNTYERLQGTRLDPDLRLEAPLPGAYRLRVLVEESNGSEMTESAQAIQLK